MLIKKSILLTSFSTNTLNAMFFPYCEKLSSSQPYKKLSHYSLGQALRAPGGWSSQNFLTIGKKVIKLSALHNGRLYLQENIPGTHLCWRMSWPQDHSAAGRIRSMKNLNDTIGNRTHELPAFCAMPQPTAPARKPSRPYNTSKLVVLSSWFVLLGSHYSDNKIKVDEKRGKCSTQER